MSIVNHPTQSVNTTARFDRAMYQAALAYYGLPSNYKRTFKRVQRTNIATGQPLYKDNGKPDTTLIGANAPYTSSQGESVWVQVNIPAETVVTAKGNPKRAYNKNIKQLLNVTLDFEYPQDPARAHRIGIALAHYLTLKGFAEPGLPVENSGAGCHIVLPLPPIEMTEDTAERWNTAVHVLVKSRIEHEFQRLMKCEQIEMDLSGFDISRVLSAPGTWRPTNPEKADCAELKQGFLRCWLSPYTNGNYPVRKECAKLAELIQAEYEKLEQQPAATHSTPPRREDEASQWLDLYAAKHSGSDRSAHFQRLVNAAFLRYGESMVWTLKDDINRLSGEKYNGRLDEEIRRSLSVVSNGNGNSLYIAAPVGETHGSFNRTDLGNAERFKAQYGERVRWCETWKSWLVFNGRCWEQDKTGYVDRLAKATVRSIYAEATNETDQAERKRIAKHAMASESSRAVRALLDRAKSELPATPDEFNTHLHLLNCKNGTLDLRTGELRPHRPSDMLTRCLKIAYNPLAACPKWLEFISSIFAGEQSLIDFMRQALGMSLSGDVSEQCLFICHGSGSNGKTTLLEVVRIILEAYGLAANIETFQLHKGERINNDVAELYGARFVTASENTLGSRLNEAFIKKATGNEPLRARRLHENEFQFMPEFTIWFAVNHKPVVKDTSKGMWRRVHFIPFNVTIEGNRVDKRLGEKLLTESEGILAWLVQGCISWYQQGRLNAPEIVQKATQAYRAEMDTAARFLSEECIINEDTKANSTALLMRYEAWCKREGEHYDAKMLKSALNERGFHSKRGTGGLWFYYGIGLIESDGSDGSDGEIDINSRREETSQKTPKTPSPTVTTVTNVEEFDL